jgi:hypothetical protein
VDGGGWSEERESDCRIDLRILKHVLWKVA